MKSLINSFVTFLYGLISVKSVKEDALITSIKVINSYYNREAFYLYDHIELAKSKLDTLLVNFYSLTGNRQIKTKGLIVKLLHLISETTEVGEDVLSSLDDERKRLSAEYLKESINS